MAGIRGRVQAYRAPASASLAVLLMAVQFATIRYASSDALVRVVLPATIAAVPLALWAYRDRIGVWVLFVGLAANLAAIGANGGLMPIERATVVRAIGEERAAEYRPGEWIRGSKDVLVRTGEGRLTALGDSIVIRIGAGGMVASPGDVVVWCGLVILAIEATAAGVRRRARPQGVAAAHAEHAAERRAAA